jgi:hypothetical protein
VIFIPGSNNTINTLRHNYFSTSNYEFAYDLFNSGSNLTIHNILNNEFVAFSNTSLGANIRVDGANTTIDNISGNVFTSYSNGTTLNWQFVDPNTTIGEVINNTFNCSTTNSTHNTYGWYIINSAQFTGTITRNTFNISNPTTNPAKRVGINIDVDTGETVTFDNTIYDNRLIINDDTSGERGFSLDVAGGGMIVFNKNTADNLKSLNYNVDVFENPDGSSNIQYNG